MPPDYSEVPYSESLHFDDNQFKKQAVDLHDQVVHAIHASKASQEEELDKQLQGLGVLRRKRRKVEGDSDQLEELAKAIAFDDGLSYNLVNSLLQDDAPLPKRTDRTNCLALATLSDGYVAFWPDATLRSISAYKIGADFRA